MLVLRGAIYHTRIKHRGRLYQRSLKTRNKNEAIRRESAFRTSLERGEFGIIDGARAGTLTDFKEKFLEALKTKVTPRTLAYYEDAYAALLKDPTLGNRRLGDIDQRQIELFIQDRKRTVGVTTVNHSLRTLRRALRLAHEWGLIAKVPRVKLLPNEPRRDFVIDETLLAQIVAKMRLKRPKGLVHHLLPFLVDTGLRLSEACNLQRDQIRLEPDAGFERGWVYVSHGKSPASRRYVPLTERAASCLEEALEHSRSENVWTASNGRKKMSRHTASEIFREVRDEMNLPWDAVLHSARHTFATNLAASGADAFTLQKLCGHSTITISQRYVHMSGKMGDDAIAKMERLRKEQQKLESERYEKKFGKKGVVQEI